MDLKLHCLTLGRPENAPGTMETGVPVISQLTAAYPATALSHGEIALVPRAAQG